MRPLFVLTIFVRAGTTTYADAESNLDAIYRSQLPNVRRDLLVVDNLLPADTVERGTGRTVIGGDNTVWEFSAIDKAVRHLGARIWDYDFINVVTSAFQQLYVGYLERFTEPVLRAAGGARVCLGHIDCYNESVGIGTARSQHWLRSCFLMLAPAELKILGSCVSVRDRRPWFSGSVDDPFGPASPISAKYQEYLIGWLLGKDIGQGVTWHRTLSLDAEGLDVFEQKALAIVNEHLLAVRLRAAGCRTVDVTWLSAQMARNAVPDWSTPWWEQLAARDRDAIVVPPAQVLA
jgi:hypothetical protein